MRPKTSAGKKRAARNVGPRADLLDSFESQREAWKAWGGAMAQPAKDFQERITFATLEFNRGRFERGRLTTYEAMKAFIQSASKRQAGNEIASGAAERGMSLSVRDQLRFHH